MEYQNRETEEVKRAICTKAINPSALWWSDMRFNQYQEKNLTGLMIVPSKGLILYIQKRAAGAV